MNASYILGSSPDLLELTDGQRRFLDSAPWVFGCNKWLTHWRAVAIRPSVWVWGDNHAAFLVDQAEEQFHALATDRELAERPRRCFAAIESERRLLELAIRRAGVQDRVELYRRGQPWERKQEPSQSLYGQIYHYASTLTDLVNLAWILNPGGDIVLLGCPQTDGSGHFWEPSAPLANGQTIEFWRRVKSSMWDGLEDLRQRGLPIKDANLLRGSVPPPRSLPRGSVPG